LPISQRDENYGNFVQQGIEAGSRPELVYSHLWGMVPGSFFTKGCDERILGSSEFVDNVIADAEEKAKETLRLTVKIADLSSLALKVCVGEGIDEAALRSGLRKRKIVHAGYSLR